MYYVIAPPKQGADLWMVSLPGPDKMRLCALVNPLASTPIAWEFETSWLLWNPPLRRGYTHKWSRPDRGWQEVSLDELVMILGERMVETLRRLGDYPTQ